MAALPWLGPVFAAMTLGWLSLYAVLVARLGALLGRPPVRRLVEAVTGAALIGLGLRVAAEQR